MTRFDSVTELDAEGPANTICWKVCGCPFVHCEQCIHQLLDVWHAQIAHQDLPSQRKTPSDFGFFSTEDWTMDKVQSLLPTEMLDHVEELQYIFWPLEV